MCLGLLGKCIHGFHGCPALHFPWNSFGLLSEQKHTSELATSVRLIWSLTGVLCAGVQPQPGIYLLYARWKPQVDMVAFPTHRPLRSSLPGIILLHHPVLENEWASFDPGRGKLILKDWLPPPPATPVQSFLMVHAYRWGVEGEGLMRASLGKKATDSLCSYPSSAFFNAF